MKKPDLSKDAIQTFFLNHAEKLAVAVCVAGLGALAWLGFSSPAFNKETPSGLANKASDQAPRYMNDQDAWKTIAQYRKVSLDASAEVRGEQAQKLDVTKFDNPELSGPRIRIPDRRGLPVIADLQNPQLVSFSAPILIKHATGVSKLKMLQDAAAADPAGGDRGGVVGGGRDPAGASSSGGEAGGRGGSVDDPGGATTPEVAERLIPGSTFHSVLANDFVGIRSGHSKAGTEAFLMNVVQISATIPLAEQKKNFVDALQSTLGFYPDRDQPWFHMVQIEIQEEGSTIWNDITDQLVNERTRQYGATAPEIAAASVYSEGITRQLPPITGFDYRKFLTAIGQPLRPLAPPSLFRAATEEEAEQSSTDVFNTSTSDDKSGQPSKNVDPPIQSFQGSNRMIYDRPASAGQTKKDVTAEQASAEASANLLVRAFDLQPPAGKKFRYRITAWVEDPNVPAAELEQGKPYFQQGFNRNSGPVGMDEGGAMGGGAASSGGGGAGLDGGGQPAGPEPGTSDAESKDPVYFYTELTERDMKPEVRQKLREQRALRKELQSRIDNRDRKAASEMWKTYCLSSKPVETDWFSIEGKLENSQVALGRVHEPLMNKVGNSELPREEPAAEMVAVQWSNLFGAWVPGYRREFYRRGETANFAVDFVHILHPVDHTVVKLEKGKRETMDLETELKVVTNQVLVDISGGRELPTTAVRSPLPNEYVGQKEPRRWAMPGETLIMEVNGKMTVHSEFADVRSFRHHLFIDDETNTFGKQKEQAAEESARGGGR